MLTSVIRSIGFLTCLPCPRKFFTKNTNISDDVSVFPIIGSIIGILGSLVLLSFHTSGLSPKISSLFTVLAIVAITGALHEDGLGDVVDSFFAIQKTSEERLFIMRNPNIGIFGTISLILSINFRVFIIEDLIIKYDYIYNTIFIIIASETISRGSMVIFWFLLPPAIKNKNPLRNQPTKKNVITSSLITLIIFSFLIFLVSNIICIFMSVIIIFLFIYFFSILCYKKIGGHTGDTIGATQQVSLIISLLISSFF